MEVDVPFPFVWHVQCTYGSHTNKPYTLPISQLPHNHESPKHPHIRTQRNRLHTDNCSPPSHVRMSRASSDKCNKFCGRVNGPAEFRWRRPHRSSHCARRARTTRSAHHLCVSVRAHSPWIINYCAAYYTRGNKVIECETVRTGRTGREAHRERETPLGVGGRGF